MIRSGRPRRRLGIGARLSVECLESRRLLAVLGLEHAEVKPDGRIVELVFAGSAQDGTGIAEHWPGWAEGARLTTNLGTELEPLGTVVTLEGDRLVWTVTFLVQSGAQTITFNTDTVLVSAPDRLIRDAQGNWTQAFNSAVADNLSLVDADGFTTANFQRGVGGVTLYVSSTHGNDARSFTQAQDPRTPLASLTRALDYMRNNDQDGRGAAIRLLRGDQFTTGQIQFGLSGQDRRHPFVIEDYWYDYGTGKQDPMTRPLIRTDWKLNPNAGLRLMRTGTNAGQSIDHVVIRRIALRAINRNNKQQTGSGFAVNSSGSNLTLDDVVISNYSTNIGIQGTDDKFTGITLLRSIILDAHLGAPSTDGFVASQGLFARGVKGMLISQSTFDYNGRTTSDMKGRDMYSHNIYLSAVNDSGPTTIWGNVIRAAGSHGVQMRAGGILAYNYLGRNALAATLDGAGGVMTRNVVEWSEDIASDLKRGGGLAMRMDYGTSLSSVIERNILVRSSSSASKSLTAGATIGEFTIVNGAIRNNTVVNAGPLLYDFDGVPDGAYHVDVSRNAIDARQRPAVIIREGNPAGLPENWDWLDSNDNLYSSNSSSDAFWSPTLRADLEGWQAYTGFDDSSQMLKPTYVNGNATIGDYLASLGAPASEDTFVSRVRGRKLDAWIAPADMQRMYAFYAASYRLVNVPAAGDDPLGFYGAVDYRPAAPVLMASSDSGASNSDNITRINANLKFTASNTTTGKAIALLRNGVVVATGVGNSTKPVTLVDPGPLADGVYTYVVRQAGNGGTQVYSVATHVTIDRTPPATPPAPVLLGIAAKTPSFQVNAGDPALTVQLLRRPAGSTDPFVVVASRAGSGALSDTTVTVAGDYEYVTRVVDLAGNMSKVSTKLKVKIL